MLKKRARTEAGVDESVPHAPAPPKQPPSAHTGREAQTRAEHAHEHVADADVQKKHVYRGPKRFKLAEED